MRKSVGDVVLKAEDRTSVELESRLDAAIALTRKKRSAQRFLVAC